MFLLSGAARGAGGVIITNICIEFYLFYVLLVSLVWFVGV